MSATAAGQVLLLAKAPVPGRVKTRLCPPCTTEQAAGLAAAALADTIDAVTASTAAARVLVVDGWYPAPPGWVERAQSGGPLGERIANAFGDCGRQAVLIGMDTPQITAAHLDAALRPLAAPGGPDAVLGPAADGGWWALGLRKPGPAAVLRDIPTSTPGTGAATLAALRRCGLRVAVLPVLRDVDTAADAVAAAALCAPGSRFARAVATELAGAVAPR
jgi:rSAM/selenodomain-associated transferase 1